MRQCIVSSADNVIELLRMVLAGQATESDWDVFIGVPIRHDPELDKVREQCEDISEREYLGGENLFSVQGLSELEKILYALENNQPGCTSLNLTTDNR